MKIKKLKENCFVIFDNEGNKFLVSYESIIARIDKNGVLALGKDWAYSQSTAKHRNEFFNLYYTEQLDKPDLEKLIKQGEIEIVEF